jgi:hypothetical protein
LLLDLRYSLRQFVKNPGFEVILSATPSARDSAFIPGTIEAITPARPRRVPSLQGGDTLQGGLAIVMWEA